MNINKEFYIGYLPKMPASFKSVISSAVAVIVAGAIVLAFILSTGQDPFAKSAFEYGNVQDFEGTIQARPLPFLLIEKNEKNNSLPTFFRYPLVGEGKHGVGNITSLDGEGVKLRGTLIHREGLRMIEVVSGSLARASRDKTDPPLSGSNLKVNGNTVTSLGQKTLSGEIVDSKCYLGVMNPGNKKAHRDCAVACLRGGVPAMFVVKDTNGNKSELWLLSTTGESINDEILDYVAEPIELNGRVTRQGDQLFFYVNPSLIKRL